MGAEDTKIESMSSSIFAMSAKKVVLSVIDRKSFDTTDDLIFCQKILVTFTNILKINTLSKMLGRSKFGNNWQLICKVSV